LSNYKKILPWLALLAAIIVGGALRLHYFNNHLATNNGFAVFVDMASHFFRQPGGYNFQKYIETTKNPDDYIFTTKPSYRAVGSFRNEKGWAFILAFLIPEGTKGINNIAKLVALYQIFFDLCVLVLLFFAGRSLAGPWCGAFTAFLYALFLPAIYFSTWVVYYYWAIPFSCLSAFFWSVLYLPERRKWSFASKAWLFVSYGFLVGFASFLRLSFVPLTLVMSPLIYLKERNIKVSLLLLFFMLLGQGVALAPQMAITYKWYGVFKLSNRGVWHTIISGLGLYPNPFGIKDSADLTAVRWAIDNGGPDLNKDGMEAYDAFMKAKALEFLKLRPDIYLRNFVSNLKRGLTMTYAFGQRYYSGPRFVGLVDSNTKFYTTPLLVISWIFFAVIFIALSITLLFDYNRFMLLFAPFLQGLYFVTILGLYFPPVDAHQTAFYPLYIQLLGGSICALILFISKHLFPLIQLLKRSNYSLKRTMYIINGEQNNPSIRARFFFFSVCTLFIFVLWLSGTVAANRLLAETSHGIPRPPIKEIILQNTGSFENWKKLNKDFLPLGWGLVQVDGMGAKLRRTEDPSKVAHGKYSAEITPSGKGIVLLYHKVTWDKLYGFLGKTVRFQAWVSSQNSVQRQVGIALNNGINSSNWPKAFYNDSGQWKLLSLTYRIPIGTEKLVFYCFVDQAANAPVYFDAITVNIITHK
jgi:hypothetical protein